MTAVLGATFVLFSHKNLPHCTVEAIIHQFCLFYPLPRPLLWHLHSCFSTRGKGRPSVWWRLSTGTGALLFSKSFWRHALTAQKKKNPAVYSCHLYHQCVQWSDKHAHCSFAVVDGETPILRTRIQALRHWIVPRFPLCNWHVMCYNGAWRGRRGS